MLLLTKEVQLEKWWGEDEEFAFSVQNQPGCYFRKQNLCSENLTVVLHSDMRISLNDTACYAT